ncbi:hypothetical protein JCM9279_001407 [Rhodotorula babjevae]
MFARTAFRTGARQVRQQTARQTRGMAHNHHTGVAPAKSDLPWIIGSALVFVPLFFSLTSPPEMMKHATSPAHPDKHHDVPASRVATESEDPADKEPSPSHAAAAEANKNEEESHSDAAEAQPEQEGKDEDKVAEGKKADVEDAPTPANAATDEEKLEATPEAKAAAKESQPGKQEKISSAIAESKEEESKKDE